MSYRRPFRANEIAERTGLTVNEVRDILRALKLTGRYVKDQLHAYGSGNYYVESVVYDAEFAPIERRNAERARIEAEAKLLDRMAVIEQRQAKARRAAERRLERSMTRAQHTMRRTKSRRPPARPAYRIRQSAREVDR